MFMTKVLVLTCCLLFGEGEADRWPSFLGVGATKVDATTLPMEWSPSSNVAWKQKIKGKGQSSPIIWEGTIYVSSIDGSMKDECYIHAIDLASGKIKWKQSVESTQKVRSNFFQSRSAPTPVADAKGVFAFFETGEVIALSHSGDLLWQRSLVTDYGEFQGTIGLASSPLQTEGEVVILVDHEGPSYLISLNKETGETKWQTERTSRSSYASPALVKIDGEEQIVCSSSGTVDGYKVATGEMLWTHEGLGGNRTSTPLPFGEGQFLVGASPGMHGEREPEARKSNFAMEVVKVDGKYQTKIVWGTEKAMPNFCSPVVIDGYAYWVNKVGVVYCFDAKTGEEKFAERIKQPCWVTPVGIGDRIYLFGKDGLTTVIAKGPEFKILAQNELWDGAAAVPQRTEEGGHGGGHGGGKPNSDNKQAEENPTESPKTKTQGELKPESNTESKGDVKPQEEKPTNAQGNPPSETQDGKSPENPARGGRPSGRDGAVFSDPVQYGVAFVNGNIVVRTGDTIYCLRKTKP